MPTGYTAPVRDGTITEFKDFALQCARAFGALIEMRDEPMGAEIPDAFEPDTDYYDRRIADAEARLRQLSAMSEDEKAQAADAAWSEQVERIDQRNAESQAHRRRYRTMLDNVRNWQPPTSNHVQFKEFMVEQLEQSIRYDCHDWDVGQRPTPGEWWIEQVENAQHTITVNTQRRAEEVERAKERTAWLRHLRHSLDR